MQTLERYQKDISKAGKDKVRATTLDAARKYLKGEIQERRRGGKQVDPHAIFEYYKATRDTELDKMLSEVSISDTDIYNLIVEEVAKQQR